MGINFCMCSMASITMIISSGNHYNRRHCQEGTFGYIDVRGGLLNAVYVPTEGLQRRTAQWTGGPTRESPRLPTSHTLCEDYTKVNKILIQRYTRKCSALLM